MIEYPTFESLRARQRNFLTEEKQRIVTAAAKRSPVGSTFLSHSSKDTEILPAVIKLLDDHGGSVYIDKKDPDLPPTMSRETATVLRERIVASRKFILLASRNSKDSRWMPWELGISDGVKRSRNTAVLGVARQRIGRRPQRPVLGTPGRHRLATRSRAVATNEEWRQTPQGVNSVASSRRPWETLPEGASGCVGLRHRNPASPPSGA